MERWTTLVERLRWPIIVGWIIAMLLGAYLSVGLRDLLSARFTLPGTDTARSEVILRDHFGQREASTSLLVVSWGGAAKPGGAQAAEAVALARRAATSLPHSTVEPPQRGPGIVYVPISTTLEPAQAQTHIDAMRRAYGGRGAAPGATTYLTGSVAVAADQRKPLADDLLTGEVVAILIALPVLLFILGTVVSSMLPLIFALAAIPSTLGIVWVLAHFVETVTYAPNLVSLIGLGIAVDYSLLIVYRYREELLAMQRTKAAVSGWAGAAEELDLSREERHPALVRTMEYAGEAVVFSGLTVAIGLGGLMLLPLPFMRSMGLAGMFAPLVSILVAITLLPALLSLLGTKLERGQVPGLGGVIRSRSNHETGFWARLAETIMRHPVGFFTAGLMVVVLLALPALHLATSPGSPNRLLPHNLESVQGILVLEHAVGAGALSPATIVIDSGRAGGVADPAVIRAMAALTAGLRADPEVQNPKAVASPSDLLLRDSSPAALARLKGFLVDPSGRYARISAPTVHEYTEPPIQGLVARIREHDVPAAHFPASAAVYVGGGPGSAVDLINSLYRNFGWIVLFVVGVTYLLLLRAFRSLLLPLKAVILNCLSVAAAYGVLVLVFQDGWGRYVGLREVSAIEAWIPVFLFAILFGLSMDYEVFLVSRIREAWDETHDNERAVKIGLERTGRLITAAAVIMMGAFLGFTLGHFVGLQQFGVGLSAAILIDATLIRMILVPSFMKLAGRWNWILPAWAARILRVEPSG